MTSKPNGPTTRVTFSLAVYTTMRAGSPAALNASSTSTSIARASPERCSGSRTAASRCFASLKSLTGSRTVFIRFSDDKIRQALRSVGVMHQDFGSFHGDRIVANRSGHGRIGGVDHHEIE